MADDIEYMVINPKNTLHKICYKACDKTYEDYIEKAKYGLKLSSVPSKFHDDNLIKVFIENSPYNIEFVDRPSDELCKIVLDNNAFAVQRIQDKVLREKYLICAIKKCPQIIYTIKNISRNLFEAVDDFTQIPQKSFIVTPKILKKIISNKKCVIFI